MNLSEALSELEKVREEKRELHDAALKTLDARQAWLESYGVPISEEFARFADALGTLVGLAASGGRKVEDE
jgi:hypothetical protein